MMQDIATKRQDVAALPINLDGDVAMQPESANGAAFSQAFRQSSESAASDKATARNDALAASARNKENRQKDADRTAASDKVQPSDKQSDVDKSEAASDSNLHATKTNAHPSADESATSSESEIDDADASTDANAGQADQTDDIDWLAYVEQVRQLTQDAEQQTIGAGDAQSSQLVTADNASEAPGMVDEAAKIASLLRLEEGFAGREHDKIPKIPELIASLGQEIASRQNGLNAKAGATQKSDSATLKELAAAITSGLQTDGADQQITQDGESLEALVTKLNGTSKMDRAKSDAELLVSVIQGKVTDKSKAGNDMMQADAAGIAQGISPKMMSLMENMVSLDEKQSEQLAQNITQRVADLVPSVSESAKKQITDALVAGMSQLKTQLQQGHESDISLKTMVTEALQQLEVNVTPALSQNIDQQLSQINTLLNAAGTTSLAAQQAAQLATPDVAIAENSQVRTESGSAARQAEGLTQPVNIHQPEGQKQLTEKIRWMVNSRNMMAEIRLDPPEMGSMQVRVNVQGDAASVSFIVQSPQAREALAQAEPRLKDMLAQQGIELGESSVHQQNQGQSDGQADGRSGLGGQTAGQGSSDDNIQVIEQPLTRKVKGGIDDYA